MTTKYVSADQLAERYGIDRSTVWRWAVRGILPQPIKLSEQCTRWKLDEIEQAEADRALCA